jgi:hypothetical protein
MNIDQFWAILDGLQGEAPEVELRSRLELLDTEELLGFQELFDNAVDDAYDWDLWGAAYIIDGGCSDDGFTDFRYGLIARGKRVYDRALQDPDSLSDVASDEDDGEISNEDFGYVAQEIYQNRTGEDLPRVSIGVSDEPTGEQWDFEDSELCSSRLPRLWAKFGLG